MALLEVAREGEIALVRLHRPDKLNAVSLSMESQLLDVLSSAAVTTSRAVVLSGAGRAFCAGADLTEINQLTTTQILAYYRASGRVYEALAGLAQPTVCAVHGHCLGAGFELALACDFRVAEEGASFGFPEVALGILPSSGGTVRLVRAVGPARARELILLGRRLDASQAHTAALVTDVVGHGLGHGRALTLARELAALPADAVEVSKRAIDLVAESSTAAALLIERLAYASLSRVATP